MKIEKDCVVKLTYRLTDGSGRLLEEKTPDEPYEYIAGHSQVIEPIERAVEGKTPGFQAELQVAPRDAYGEYDSSLVVEIPLAQFPDHIEPEVGMKFQTHGPRGKPIAVRIIEVDEEMVTIDGNHPLSGLELIFELKVIDVRAATSDELRAGVAGVGTLGSETEGGSGALH